MQGRVEYFRLFQGPKREKDSRHVVWQTQTCLKAFDTEKVSSTERMETPGQWLEKALVDLCQRVETGLGLGMDTDMISGLVSYCELAHPQDAKEYLDVILSLSPTIYLILFSGFYFVLKFLGLPQNLRSH